jgi:exoribonuclease R
LTKQKEREAIWRAKKLAYYEEFFGAASGIVGNSAPPEAKVRFATAANNLHLIGSMGVINALHAFTDEIAESNFNRSDVRHDKLWSRLIWEIRGDLNDPPTKNPDEFRARLWASGVRNKKF